MFRFRILHFRFLFSFEPMEHDTRNMYGDNSFLFTRYKVNTEHTAFKVFWKAINEHLPTSSFSYICCHLPNGVLYRKQHDSSDSYVSYYILPNGTIGSRVYKIYRSSIKQIDKLYRIFIR